MKIRRLGTREGYRRQSCEDIRDVSPAISIFSHRVFYLFPWYTQLLYIIISTTAPVITLITLILNRSDGEIKRERLPSALSPIE